ncbi:carboxymuconolactone decarboxylase family protein [Saccharopolyspora flava]|uniref:Alkylhydroperoxidase AhpD family core domain-containing protein n=1 Tax=Saccharopolyspora flava TaxID=95161 RepID=A0A1I6V357_9PSEU|nr:carboxymuconolactone decarboxylase family protein [Saccharopolyspora flava]SFT08102.1 alkylhydroperoxidase AhpD family core domain-containing protein [Saccharopolyspora flava]
MADRIFLDKQTPSAFKALSATATEIRSRAREAGLGRVLLELVNIRASQLNGCAFCLDRHTRLALEAGETPERLGVLPAWRETELFTAEERAALELAEAVTLVAAQRPDQDTYDQVRKVLSDDQVSVITWAAITINAFNRVSILSGHPVRARTTS